MQRSLRLSGTILPVGRPRGRFDRPTGGRVNVTAFHNQRGCVGGVSGIQRAKTDGIPSKIVARGTHATLSHENYSG
jgi:hypothetical protein